MGAASGLAVPPQCDPHPDPLRGASQPPCTAGNLSAPSCPQRPPESQPRPSVSGWKTRHTVGVHASPAYSCASSKSRVWPLLRPYTRVMGRGGTELPANPGWMWGGKIILDCFKSLKRGGWFLRHHLGYLPTHCSRQTCTALRH